MQLKKIILILILINLMSLNTNAFTEKLEIQVFENGLTTISHLIDLNQEKEITINSFCKIKPNNFLCVNNSKKCNYELKENKIKIINLNKINSLKISYPCYNLTNKTKEKWKISITKPNLKKITLFFPENTKITKYNPITSISINKNQLILTWENETLQEQNNSVEYSFELKTKQTNMLLIPIIIGVILIILILIILKEKNKLIKLISKKETLNTIQKELLIGLSSKEKEIVYIIFGSDGLTQKKILIKSSLSKATLSRTLKSLEQKNFIKIIQDGYTNRIYLSDWFKEKK